MNSLIAAIFLLLTFVLVLAAGIGVSYLAASSFFRLLHPPQKPRGTLTAATVGSGD